MMSSSFSLATSYRYQRNNNSTVQPSYQRVSASKYALLVNTPPQLLVVSWLVLLGLLAVLEYLLEEGIWNWLASHALLEELTHRGGLQEVVRFT